MVQKTYYPKGSEMPASEWLLVDASGQSLGRLATQIAAYLMGKHKPTFTPGVDLGDHVVVINVEKLSFTQKRLEDKMYHHHTGYPGGIKSATLQQMLEKHPERVIERAVWGMLPHNKYGRSLLKKLRVYAGAEHQHEAQSPKPVA
ncbi:MAG: 50S ribosomal protein L13 [Anaerolineae bacterium]|nr:50S ribosomal protein L13 [Anaerolineae bacterium]